LNPLFHNPQQQQTTERNIRRVRIISLNVIFSPFFETMRADNRLAMLVARNDIQGAYDLVRQVGEMGADFELFNLLSYGNFYAYKLCFKVLDDFKDIDSAFMYGRTVQRSRCSEIIYSALTEFAGDVETLQVIRAASGWGQGPLSHYPNQARDKFNQKHALDLGPAYGDLTYGWLTPSVHGDSTPYLTICWSGKVATDASYSLLDRVIRYSPEAVAKGGVAGLTRWSGFRRPGAVEKVQKCIKDWADYLLQNALLMSIKRSIASMSDEGLDTMAVFLKGAYDAGYIVEIVKYLSVAAAQVLEDVDDGGGRNSNGNSSVSGRLRK